MRVEGRQSKARRQGAWLRLGLAALAVVSVGCQPGPPAPVFPPAVPPGSVLFVGAGDIALCGLATGMGQDGHQRTARLIDFYPPETPVFVIGDNAYAEGDDAEFAVCYDAPGGWGRFKARTYPVPGNHEYRSRGAAPYYRYFGERAGDPARGYYGYSLGAWHLLALNSSDNCREVPCDAASAQVAFIKAQLAAHPTRCALAYFHHPQWTSNRSGPGSNQQVRPLVDALYEGGADLILVGHAHSYERFKPMDPAGNVDPTRGLRHFVLGTGGAELRKIYSQKPHSERFQAVQHGIFELVLHPESYDWRFISVEGKVLDQGSERCH